MKRLLIALFLAVPARALDVAAPAAVQGPRSETAGAQAAAVAGFFSSPNPDVAQLGGALTALSRADLDDASVRAGLQPLARAVDEAAERLSEDPSDRASALKLEALRTTALGRLLDARRRAAVERASASARRRLSEADAARIEQAMARIAGGLGQTEGVPDLDAAGAAPSIGATATPGGSARRTPLSRRAPPRQGVSPARRAVESRSAVLPAFSSGRRSAVAAALAVPLLLATKVAAWAGTSFSPFSTWEFSPANPANPASPLNPINPISPFNPMNSSGGRSGEAAATASLSGPEALLLFGSLAACLLLGAVIGGRLSLRSGAGETAAFGGFFGLLLGCLAWFGGLIAALIISAAPLWGSLVLGSLAAALGALLYRSRVREAGFRRSMSGAGDKR